MVNFKKNIDVKPVLKWAGGKKKVIPHIQAILPSEGKRRLVEPFVGGGSVFLNLDFDEYLLVDMNLLTVKKNLNLNLKVAQEKLNMQLLFGLQQQKTNFILLGLITKKDISSINENLKKKEYQLEHLSAG